jgi:hypothetical protein
MSPGFLDILKVMAEKMAWPQPLSEHENVIQSLARQSYSLNVRVYKTAQSSNTVFIKPSSFNIHSESSNINIISITSS